MKPRIAIKSVQSTGGSVIELEPSCVVCVVGSNNVGKSQLLREIHAALERSPQNMLTVAQLDVMQEPSVFTEELLDGFAELASHVEHAPGQQDRYTSVHDGQSLDADAIRVFWNRPNGLHLLSRFFVTHNAAGQLASIATQQVQPADLRRGGGVIARLQRDGSLAGAVSELCSENFGFPLTFDRITGRFVYRVGTPGVEAPPYDNPNEEYASAVEVLPELHTQGDGVKSFLGMVIQLVAGTAQIMLFDEPEAFLHPAQAQALGRFASRTTLQETRQVIVATHDRDFVLGCLDSGARVHVVRVSRDADDRTVLLGLDPVAVSDLWQDATLRYSNVLQGLFHRQVVVCESDADCRFFRAALDGVSTAASRPLVSETLFVPCGGKGAAPKFVKALARIGVPTRVIVDFDFLNDKGLITRTLDAMGQELGEELLGYWTTVATHLNGKDGWKSIKQLGLNGLQGAAHRAANDLLEGLVSKGIFVIPLGEIEQFDRSISADKSAWVTEMLEKNGHATNGDVRKFVEPLTAPPEAAS